jgi:hypothetical protein
MALAYSFDDDNLPDPGITIDVRQQDAYWCSAYARERYYRPGCDYEDYAPAYCVGYVGYAQYGGSWEEAEKSLCANWERLRAGSRLTDGEARAAIRAAWDRVEDQAREAVHLFPRMTAVVAHEEAGASPRGVPAGRITDSERELKSAT